MSADGIPLWQRSLGLGLLLLAVLLYAPDPPLLLALLTTALAIGGAYLVTRASLAVALGAAMTAGVFASLRWPFELADYVLILAGSAAVVILVRRFRHRMRDTHDLRWSRRRDQP